MNTYFNLNRMFSLSILFTNIYNTMVFGLNGFNISAKTFFDLTNKKILGGS